MAKSIKETKGSSPDVVAQAMVTAVESKHPKTRYKMGKFAKLFMAIHRYFGDRAYDFIITKPIEK
jgi:hypothetical protein